MSQWTYGEFETELRMGNLAFQERYERCFEDLGVKEQELMKIGKGSAFTRGYCDMFYSLFDSLFGEGTTDKLFTDDTKYDIEYVDECYASFLDAVDRGVREVNQRRNARIGKYTNGKHKR